MHRDRGRVVGARGWGRGTGELWFSGDSIRGRGWEDEEALKPDSDVNTVNATQSCTLKTVKMTEHHKSTVIKKSNKRKRNG